MNWYNFCKNNFDLGNATAESLKIYVVKGKITIENYKEITGKEFLGD